MPLTGALDRREDHLAFLDECRAIVLDGIRNDLFDDDVGIKGKGDGKPLCKIFTEIPLEYEPYTGVFWPWRESEITDLVHACPNVRYYVDAYDVYHDGVYVCTRYCFMSICGEAV